MAKLVVLLVFAFACLGFTIHFFPSVTAHAFSVGTFPISWALLLGCAYFYAGHKLVGRK